MVLGKKSFIYVAFTTKKSITGKIYFSGVRVSRCSFMVAFVDRRERKQTRKFK